MSERENVKILAFVGLSGSGKSVAVDYFTKKGYPKVYFGGVILDGLSELGLEHTQENEKKYREEMREKEGKDFVVKRIIKQIHDLIGAGQHKIVADGLYTWTEYKILKHEFPGELTVVSVVTPKHLRKQRMAKRPIRPLSSEEVDQRDWAEIENIEKGGPIAIADYFVHNDKDVENLEAQIANISHQIDF
ncbi:MAG TPA: AAA family ATPase [Candidatus Saccharimonadales bacterium]